MTYNWLGGKTFIINNLKKNQIFQDIQNVFGNEVEFASFGYKLANTPFYPTNRIILELKENISISQVLQMVGSVVSVYQVRDFNTYLLKVHQVVP